MSKPGPVADIIEAAAAASPQGALGRFPHRSGAPLA
jgi:hypothetical protein